MKVQYLVFSFNLNSLYERGTGVEVFRGVYDNREDADKKSKSLNTHEVVSWVEVRNVCHS